MHNFICFSVNNWEARKARKHHFMRCMSLREDVGKVLYVEPPMNFFKILLGGYPKESKERIARALKGELFALTPKLLLFTPLFFFPGSYTHPAVYRINALMNAWIVRMKAKASGIGTYVLWLYHPFDTCLLGAMKEKECAVFDWAEEWYAYHFELPKAARNAVQAAQQAMVRTCDIVFTVSSFLEDAAVALNPSSYRLKDGTDIAVFKKGVGERPEELAGISGPILGYLGTISERVDIALLAECAAAYPKATIILIGGVLEQRIDITQLRTLPNVRILGMKPFDQLGTYSRHFNVCLLPYKPELTTNFPTKLFDYLATGLPTVSTELAETRDFSNLAYFANSHEEFIRLIGVALHEDDPSLRERRVSCAAENSWEQRAEEAMSIINDHCCR